jgi:hypothetical protein
MDNVFMEQLSRSLKHEKYPSKAADGERGACRYRSVDHNDTHRLRRSMTEHRWRSGGRARRAPLSAHRLWTRRTGVANRPTAKAATERRLM